MMTYGGPWGGTCMSPNSQEPIHFCEKNTRFVVYNGGDEGGAHGGPFFENIGGPWGGPESTRTHFMVSKITFFCRSHMECQQKGRLPPHDKTCDF